MKSEEIYKSIKSEVVRDIYNYDDQIVAIAKWVEYKLNNNGSNIFITEVYKALGWQGGTIHQVLEEIQRLKKLETKEIYFLIWISSFAGDVKTGKYFESKNDAIKYIESKITMTTLLDELDNEKLINTYRYYDLGGYYDKYKLINPISNETIIDTHGF
jgi:hypothetical protein